MAMKGDVMGAVGGVKSLVAQCLLAGQAIPVNSALTIKISGLLTIFVLLLFYSPFESC
jgi:hypothetical protein